MYLRLGGARCRPTEESTDQTLLPQFLTIQAYRGSTVGSNECALIIRNGNIQERVTQERVGTSGVFRPADRPFREIEGRAGNPSG